MCVLPGNNLRILCFVTMLVSVGFTAHGMEKKRDREKPVENLFDFKKSKITSINEYELTQAIHVKKMDLIEDLIVTHNVPFDVQEINTYGILQEAIKQQRFVLAQKLIKPGIAFLRPNFFGMSPFQDSIFFDLFWLSPSSNPEVYDIICDVIKSNYKQQEDKTEHVTSRALVTLLRTLVITLSHITKGETRDKRRTVVMLDVLLKSATALLEAGYHTPEEREKRDLASLTMSDDPKLQEYVAPLKKLLAQIYCADALHAPELEPHNLATLLEIYCNEDSLVTIDFPFKIALSTQNIDLLWLTHDIAKNKNYDQRDLEKLFTKPDFPHYCTDDCKCFLPRFNFVKKLSYLKGNQKIVNVFYKFK